MPASCPSRKVIRQRLHEHADISTEELHELLATNDSKVSLALDCWSSRSNYGFMGIIPSHSFVAPISLLPCNSRLNGRYSDRAG
jgi:hypothetical protein